MSAVAATFARLQSVGVVEAIICCTGAEADEAGVIRQLLEDRGIRCAFSSSGVRPSDRPVMILLLTKSTVDSETIEQEVGRAVYRGLPLVVLRLENVNPSKKLAYYLASRPCHRLNALTPPLEQYITDLLQTVELSLSNLSGGKGETEKPQLLSTSETAPPAPEAPTPAPSPPTNSPGAPRIAFISCSAADLDPSVSELSRLLERFRYELEIQFGDRIRMHRSPDGILPDTLQAEQI